MRDVFHAIRLPFLLSFTIAVSACSCDRGKNHTAEPARPGADETFARLSEEQKIGQLLCLTIDPVGYFLIPEYRDKIQNLVGKCHPGALYFLTDPEKYTRVNIEEFNGVKLRGVVLDLQRLCDVSFLVAADFGNGAWFWDHTATRFPSSMALGATCSPAMSFREGKITAHEAIAQGVNWLFAPVTSLGSECGSARLDPRSFGSDPDSVAEFVAQFVKGTQDTGAAVCLISLGSDNEGFTDYSKPIASGVSAGAQSIMGSPVETPESREPQAAEPSDRPKAVLAERYGFTGLVVRHLSEKSMWTPDDSGMSALVESFASGQDMLVFPDDPDRIEPYLDFLLTRLLLKKTNVEAVNPSVRKILALKEKLNLHRIGRNQDQAISGLGIREYRQTALDIAKASLTLLKNDGGLIPLKDRGRSTLFVTISDSSSTIEATTFIGDIEKTHPELKQINILGTTDSRIVIEVLRRAGEAKTVVCTFFLKPAPSSRASGLTKDHLSLMQRLIDVNRNCICISFSGPCLINVLPGVKAFLAAYSLTPMDTNAALGALLGESSVSGRLPFALSEEYPMGFGLRLPGPASR